MTHKVRGIERHNVRGGTGTIEAPAGSIAAVLPKTRFGGFVYVQPGSNPGMPGFTIPDGVSVVSNAQLVKIPGKNIRNVTIKNNEILNGVKLDNVTGTVDIIDNRVAKVVNEKAIEPQNGILVTQSR